MGFFKKAKAVLKRFFTSSRAAEEAVAAPTRSCMFFLSNLFEVALNSNRQLAQVSPVLPPPPTTEAFPAFFEPAIPEFDHCTRHCRHNVCVRARKISEDKGEQPPACLCHMYI
jgi:hypothetical protein